MRALDGSWWRPEPEVLQEAKEDAARLAIYEQERAGLDLVTDGEAQRAAYDRHFLAGWEGVDLHNLEVIRPESSPSFSKRDEAGAEEYSRLSRLKPQVTGEVRWRRAVSVDELRFAKSVAKRPVKANVIGPISLSGQLVDRYYGDPDALLMALASALNSELRALDAAGADVLQIDEPAFHFRLPQTRHVAEAAIKRMVEGVRAPVIVHVCYGYALVYKEKSASAIYPEILEILAGCPIEGISLEYEQPGHDPEILRHCGDKHVVLGLLNLGTQEIEMAEHIASRIRGALETVPPERLHPSSDCGMWFLPRDVALGKIRAMVEGKEKVLQYMSVAPRPYEVPNVRQSALGAD
ncbi:MAG: hypothetical protein MI785_05750 [Kiloniellales bacterium]|nr:hypothetical protein [Kiloniellales bacterium]